MDKYEDQKTMLDTVPAHEAPADAFGTDTLLDNTSTSAPILNASPLAQPACRCQASLAQARC